jgi:hypothetical protein
VNDNASENNTFFLLWAGALIFLMQAGFATLSAGSIRQKNVKNILLKNLLDACMGALTWYFVGYAFAYQLEADGNGFIGGGPAHFMLSGVSDTGATTNYGNDWISWYFQFAVRAHRYMHSVADALGCHTPGRAWRPHSCTRALPACLGGSRTTTTNHLSCHRLPPSPPALARPLRSSPRLPRPSSLVPSPSGANSVRT